MTRHQGGRKNISSVVNKKKGKKFLQLLFPFFFFGFPCDIDNKEKRKKFFFQLTDGWIFFLSFSALTDVDVCGSPPDNSFTPPNISAE
jgi:hypothetical protein